jgi:hypothetical protein
VCKQYFATDQQRLFTLLLLKNATHIQKNKNQSDQTHVARKEAKEKSQQLVMPDVVQRETRGRRDQPAKEAMFSLCEVNADWWCL